MKNPCLIVAVLTFACPGCLEMHGTEMVRVYPAPNEIAPAHISLSISDSERKHLFRQYEQIMFDVKITNLAGTAFSYKADVFGKKGFLNARLYKGDEKIDVKQKDGPSIVAGLPLTTPIVIKPGGISHQPIFVDSLFYLSSPGKYFLILSVKGNEAITASYSFIMAGNHK